MCGTSLANSAHRGRLLVDPRPLQHWRQHRRRRVAAKQAAALPQPTQPPPTSLRTAKAMANQAAMAAEHQSWSLIASTGIRELMIGHGPNHMLTYIGVSGNLAMLLIRFRSNVLVGATRNTSSNLCACGGTSTSRRHILLECRLLARHREAVLRLLPQAERTDLAKVLQGGQFPKRAHSPRVSDGSGNPSRRGLETCHPAGHTSRSESTPPGKACAGRGRQRARPTKACRH